MRIVLTGGGGFVGARLARMLVAAGHEVHALGRSSVPGCRWHACDLLTDDPTAALAAAQPTHLVHLAWNADRRTLLNGIENLAWVAASLRLVLAFRACGGSRAVIAGTSAEYDWSEAVLDEADTALRPATGYGLAKRSLFELLTRTGSIAPLSIAWARIFFPFGPNDKPDRLLSQVIDSVAAGRSVDCSSGLQVRPFLHVDDAAAALASLLSSSLEGAVNIALDEVMSVRELATIAASHAGDVDLVRFGTRPLQPGEPALMRATVDRLAQTGFRPRWSIADGVRATVEERLDIRNRR